MDQELQGPAAVARFQVWPAQPTTHQSLEEAAEAKDSFWAVVPTTVAKVLANSPTAMVPAFGATGYLATEVVSMAMDSNHIMDMA